jgi:hypothetical protein
MTPMATICMACINDVGKFLRNPRDRFVAAYVVASPMFGHFTESFTGPGGRATW